MKKLFFIIGAILIYSSTFAQKEKQLKPGEELKTDKNSPDWFRYYKSPKLQGRVFTIPLDSALRYGDAIAYEPKAKLLYRTDKGAVYALPLDNMPCLRPGIHSNMPIYKLSPNGYIPNALNKQPKLNGTINGIKIIPVEKWYFKQHLRRLDFPGKVPS